MSLLDENAEILAKIERNGGDLSPTRLVDFSHAFPDQISAEAFAADCERSGLKVDIDEIDDDDYPWDVSISTEIQPSSANITDLEERFDARARSYGGYADGWGFWGGPIGSFSHWPLKTKCPLSPQPSRHWPCQIDALKAACRSDFSQWSVMRHPARKIAFPEAIALWIYTMTV